MADSTVSFDILARDKASNAFDSAAKSSDGLFGKLKGLGGFLAGGLVAGAALEGVKSLASGLGDMVKEAAESEKIGRITANAIKATGGAANITAGQVGDLAERLSNATAVDDELIQSGANLLLTFKNIRNEVGKGNDVFNQANAAALDLAAAGFGTVESASVQLGKALNDPLKGITALAKSGVTFTDQQKDQIKTLVESGKTLEAQKIILGEINAQVGGAAKAAADPMARLSVVAGNLKEQLGAQLLPVVTRVAEWFADRLPGALDAGFAAFRAVREWIQPAIDAVSSFIYTLRTGFSVEDYATPVERLAFFVRDVLMPAFAEVVEFVRDNLKPILIGLGVVLALLVSPVGVVIAAVVAAYLKFEVFRNVVDAVVSFIIGTAIPAIALLAGFVIEQLGKAVDWVKEMWPQISEAIGHVMVVIQTIVSTVLAVVTAAWRMFGDDIINVVSGAFGIVRGVVEFIVNLIATIIRTVLAVINGDWGKAWDAMKDGAKNAVDAIGKVIGGLVGVLKGIFGGIFDYLRTLVGDFVDAGINIVQGLIDGIKRSASRLVSAIQEFVIDKIPGPVRKALGIASPSRVMREIGENIVAGLNLGITSSKVAMPGLFDGLTPAFAGDGLAALTAPTDVRVFIGDRELTDIIRVEQGRERDERVLLARRGVRR